jgi:hypothetical protein
VAQILGQPCEFYLRRLDVEVADGRVRRRLPGAGRVDARAAERGARRGAALRRERCQTGPEDAGSPMRSRGNTAGKGWSWPNFRANLSESAVLACVHLSRPSSQTSVDSAAITCRGDVGKRHYWPSYTLGALSFGEIRLRASTAIFAAQF